MNLARSQSWFENATFVVVVDKEAFDEKVSRSQRPRLEELKRGGAAVRLASGYFGGSNFRGSMHMKTVVIDSCVAFTGSANLTKKARKNIELVSQVTGPAVHDIVVGVRHAFSSGSDL